MQVLLLGELSSLHKYLKEGLQQLGSIKVTLASNGDGWKEIAGSDLTLTTTGGKGVQKLYNKYMQPYLTAKQFKGYDIVQLVNPLLFPFPINTNVIRKIAACNNCISLISAGLDYAITRAYREKKFEYYMCDYDTYYLDKYDPKTISGKVHIKSAKDIEKMADIIIPILYEYSIGYDTPKLNPAIPFAINTADIEYHTNKVHSKIVFFHGLNSELKKGTPFIREALNKLQNQYPNDVEVIIDGHIPFHKYVEIMKRANIVIDQCCSYGYGINAGIAMAQGKVVMSGCRKETLDAFGLSESPIIPIQPNEKQIYQQLLFIIENKNNIEQWGYESRAYVENVHDYIKIAQCYVNAWHSTGKV